MLPRSELSLQKLIYFAKCSTWSWIERESDIKISDRIENCCNELYFILLYFSHMCSFDNRLKNFVTVSKFYKGRVQCWALLFQSVILTDLMHHRGWIVNLLKLFSPSVCHSFLCLVWLVPYKVFSSHTSDVAKAEENHSTTNEQCQIVINLYLLYSKVIGQPSWILYIFQKYLLSSPHEV